LGGKKQEKISGVSRNRNDLAVEKKRRRGLQKKRPGRIRGAFGVEGQPER